MRELSLKPLIHTHFIVDRDAFILKEKFMRFPLKMDAPEVVLCQAHGQARTLSDFLHENGNSCSSGVWVFQLIWSYYLIFACS